MNSNDKLDASYEIDEELDYSEEEEGEGVEPIAVIAMAGRFPGAPDVTKFWENLRDGVESVKFFTDEELLAANIDPEVLKNPRFVRADAILDDIDLFDAEFFNYSPREAEIMDPQHRLFMETAWHAMELAGYNPDTIEERVGVFGGSGLSSYLIRNLLKNSEYVDSVGSFQTMLANSQDFLCTKVSYKMNLMGPSVNVNTLCSSSMVAVHLACQSLWDYQTDMNIAGGVSIQASRNEAFFYQEGGIGAFDGHCRAFDARAGGTVSGSGLGIVVLKRLSDAIADGDTVHAVIRGSAINNDGSVKLSYTAPSIDGQAEVIAEAQSMADINPETINYIEAHGTGTSLGDPIEISGLTKAYRVHTEKNGFCAIGSVKTNIGHLVTAGGVASLIKTVMALKHRQIPPSLNYEKPNPKIDFESSPFFVNTNLREWEPSVEGEPRRAGISSFGIGGTNAHAVVEEAPEMEETDEGRDIKVLPFSARSETAADQLRQDLARFLEENPDTNLADMAYTMQVGRKGFSQRRAIVVSNSEEAIEALKDPARVMTQFQESDDREVVFLFSGQGSQYPGMAKPVYDSEPVFQEAVDTCAEILESHLGCDLRSIMWPENDEENPLINETQYTQPALFTIEYAQAQLLMSWGIKPAAMIGHSIGEYVAATIAGVFSLEDALPLVATRGRMISELPGGDMLAVPMQEMDLLPLLDAELSLAAVNGDGNCVVSGTPERIAALSETLKARKVRGTVLHTSHAFHSHMMDPILDAFTERVSQAERNAPQIPYVSNVTGKWITDEEATDPGYYARHLRGAVRYHDGLTTLFENPDRVLLECGPGRTLVTLARRHPIAKEHPNLNLIHSIRHPKEKTDDLVHLHTTAARLWMAGVKVDWKAYHEEQTRRRIPLPTYPFERRRFWIEPDMMGYKSGQSTAPAVERAGVRKMDMADWFYSPSYKKTKVPPVPKELPPSQRWLIFGETDGLSRDFANRLIDEGQKVVTVSKGETYNKLDHAIFQLHPGNADNYKPLVADLKEENLLPNHIIYFRTSHEADNGSQGLAESRDNGFYNVLYTLQALDAINHGNDMSLAIVSDRLTEVTGEEPHLAGSTALGLLQVIPQEFPHISARLVDVADAPGWRRKQLVDQLVTELNGDDHEPVVAYKGNKRWVRTFEAVQLQDEGNDVLKTNGSYAIFGGLDGTGLEIAEFFARTEGVKLLLTCAGDFPAQASWADSKDARVRRLHALTERGIRIIAKSHVDISNSAALSQLIASSEAELGHFNGIVHADGPTGRDQVVKPVAELKPETCEPLFTAKGAGLFALEEALGESERDFVVVLSSLASILGGLGLSAYAASTSFVDQFVARHNRNHPQTWLSFNWDGWLSGEAVALGAAHKELVIKFEEGIAALMRAIASDGMDQIVLSVEDLPARIEVMHQPRVEEKAAKVTQRHPRPNLTNPYIAPRNETEEKIAEIWQERLGIETVGVNDNYFDLGGDSLLIVKIRRALQEEFGGELLTSELFEHPTVAALASYFNQEKEEATMEQAADRAARQKAALEQEMAAAAGSRRRRRPRF